MFGTLAATQAFLPSFGQNVQGGGGGREEQLQFKLYLN